MVMPGVTTPAGPGTLYTRTLGFMGLFWGVGLGGSMGFLWSYGLEKALWGSYGLDLWIQKPTVLRVRPSI